MREINIPRSLIGLVISFAASSGKGILPIEAGNDSANCSVDLHAFTRAFPKNRRLFRQLINLLR